MKARKHDPIAGKRRVVGTMKKASATASSNPTPANDPTAPRASAPLVFDGTTIRDRDQYLNLTDMWRAAGSDPSKRPSEWLRHEATTQFLAYLESNMGGAHICETRRGVGGGTWAHWQVGMAYAKHLSPAFHAWCNEVVRAVMEGRMAPVGPGLAKTSAAPVSTGLTAEQVVELVGKVVEPIVETQRSLAGALAQLQAQVIALHRDHNAALDMAAIGGQCATVRIKKVITRLAKEKARYLGGKKAEASFNRKFHLRAREACGGFQGPWDRLPRGLLGAAETCLANMEREVRADTLLAERHGYKPVQMNIEDARDRRPN